MGLVRVFRVGVATLLFGFYIFPSDFLGLRWAGVIKTGDTWGGGGSAS